jgi:hypothetical protein
MKRLVIFALLGVLGCEKETASKPDPVTVTSGQALSADETAMLVHLPAGNVALYGRQPATVSKVHE